LHLFHRLPEPDNGADFLDGALEIRHNLIVGDTQDEIAGEQQFVVAMTIVRELGIFLVIRTIQFDHDAALPPQQIDPGRRIKAANRYRFIARKQWTEFGVTLQRGFDPRAGMKRDRAGSISRITSSAP
jgi:hypothetical protein